jgi:hypothetical protein
MSAAHPELLAFAQGLGAAQRVVRRAGYARALADGLRAGARWSAVVAFVGLPAIPAAVWWGVSPQVVAAMLGVVWLIGQTALLGTPLGRVWRRGESLGDVAERLDLAAGTQNRVAVALDLLNAHAAAPFELAAVADGRTTLERVCQTRPFTEPTIMPWRRASVLAGAALAVLVALPWLAGRGSEHSRPTNVSPAPGGNAVRGADAVAAATGQPPAPLPPIPPPASTSGDAGTSAATAMNPEGSAPRAAPAGGSSNASASNTTHDRGSSQSGRGTPIPTATPTTAAPPPTRAGEAAAESAGAAAIASAIRGGMGRGGKARAVENAWQQREAGASASNADTSGDLPEADPADENQHRAGMQPMLQDRKQGPTRELTLSSDEGGGGTGRGGPTPPKRARGVGALLLAVPLPDFLPGQLLPGPAKLSREATDPQRLPGRPAAAIPAAPRGQDESWCESYVVPPELADAAARYFRALHAAKDEADH